MLSHEQVWAAIDALAAQNGLSPSGLARRAGLDPTTFNPSKRIAGDGRPRWPSTESLAKILEATGEPLSQFVARVDGDNKALRMGGRHILSRQQLPFAGFATVSGRNAFDSHGQPAGPGWAQLSFPDPKVKDAFALEVTGDRFMPLYRAGDIIIAACSLPIRRGDRVVVKQAEGALSIMTLSQRRRDRTEFTTVKGLPESCILKHDQIEWLARIFWASQ